MNRFIWIVALASCTGPKDDDPPSEGDADTDTDTDTDTDSDTGSDPVPVDVDGDGFTADVDCDDTDETVYPGAHDICGDDRVTDCNRTTDDGLVTVDEDASFTGLQQAIDQSSAGSTVLVCPGAYVGTFSSQDPLNLVSHGGRDVTVLDGNRAGSVLVVPGGTTITGFTVTDGRSPVGGGIVQRTPGTLVITGCSVVENNGLAVGGGVVTSTDSLVTIADTTISSNRAQFGGGLYVDARTTVDLTGSTLEGNGVSSSGAGAFVTDGAIVGGIVTANVSDDAGGGISTFGVVALTGIEITANASSSSGGGIVTCNGPFPCEEGGSLSLVGVSVHDNASEAGAGIFASVTDVVLDDTSEVRANDAGIGVGGGVYLSGGSLTGGVVSENHAGSFGGGVSGDLGPSIVGVEIRDNTSDTSGGGVGVFDSYTITGVSISGNVANYGGGIYTEFGTVEATDVAITDNQAYLGGGLFTAGAGLTVRNGSVLRNLAGTGGGAVVYAGTLASVGTDWGEGADDNVPSDVTAGADLLGYGAGETFECTEIGCDPTP